MKKLCRLLTTIALSAPLLTGCDLFESSSDTKEESLAVEKLELKDYTQLVALNSKYTFDGKVFATFEDNSKKEVTSECSFRDVDTSKLGNAQLRVNYETTSKIYYTTANIFVYDPAIPEEVNKISRIELRDYSTSVALNSKYDFDGKVYAVYSDQTEKEITSKCSFSEVDTSSLGSVEFKVDYICRIQTVSYTYSDTAQILVYDPSLPDEPKEIEKIVLRNYTSSVVINSEYEFDGQIVIVYKDKSEEVLTTGYSINKVDTSKLGKAVITIEYVTRFNTYTATANILVYDPEAKSELLSISVSNYTDTVEKGEEYTFDGEVYATYKGVSEPILVSNEDCSFTTINTGSAGKKSLTVSFSDTYNDEDGNPHTVTKSKSISITVYVNPESISATDISIGVGKNKAIELTFSPSDTTKKDVTFVSNDESIATVDTSGNVTGIAIGNTTITVTSSAVSSVYTTVNVVVTEVAKDAWTILMYVCGADLESASGSDGGQATADLQEIASVNGQPDDVNVVVQAGGAESWKSTYSSVINPNYANRFHLKNKKYEKDEQITKVNMGLASTLESFLTWGMQTYPAENYGLIFWNHGGAMTGCCFDEQYSDDSITPAEASQAIKAAKSATGESDKFEFIGYDCCLMQVQDIAGLNSEYAKYQIASEESEWGYGWTYDGWIDDLFAKKSTTNILKAIVDSFKSETTSVYGSGSSNDQTLSYLDLSKWDAYETAWEDMASSLSSVVNSSSKWSTLENVIDSCQKYGETSDGWDTIYPFDVFDVGSFCTKMKASSSYKSNTTLMNKITEVQTAESELVAYEWHGGGSSGSTGVALFAPLSGYSYKSEYSTSQTTLTNWRNICINYGSWYY